MASTADAGAVKPWEQSNTVAAGDSLPANATSMDRPWDRPGSSATLASTGTAIQPYQGTTNTLAPDTAGAMHSPYSTSLVPYGSSQPYGSSLGSPYSSMYSSPYSGSGYGGYSRGEYGGYGGYGSSSMYGANSLGSYGGSYGGMYGQRGMHGSTGMYGGGGMYGGNRMYGANNMYGSSLSSPYGMNGQYGPMQGGGPGGPGGPHALPGADPQRTKWQVFMEGIHHVMHFFGRVSFLMDENAHAVHFFVTALLQLLDRASFLWGEIARFVLRLLGYKKPLSPSQKGAPDGEQAKALPPTSSQPTHAVAVDGLEAAWKT